MGGMTTVLYKKDVHLIINAGTKIIILLLIIMIIIIKDSFIGNKINFLTVIKLVSCL